MGSNGNDFWVNLESVMKNNFATCVWRWLTANASSETRRWYVNPLDSAVCSSKVVLLERFDKCIDQLKNGLPLWFGPNTEKGGEDCVNTWLWGHIVGCANTWLLISGRGHIAGWANTWLQFLLEDIPWVVLRMSSTLHPGRSSSNLKRFSEIWSVQVNKNRGYQ